MPEQDALQIAKELLEAETLAEKEKETPTVDTATIEDDSLYRDTEGGNAVVNEPKDGVESDKKKNDDDHESEESAADDEQTASGTEADAAVKDAEKKAKAGMDEDTLAALFGGEDLSEDFRNKAKTIFEAALHDRVEFVRAELQEEFDSKLEEETKTILEGLTAKLDDYLNYVVNEWMQENEIAIEHGLKNEISESFLSDLKVLFEKHNIEVSDEKFDALDEANKRVEELETKLNEQLDKNIELSKNNSELEVTKIFTNLSEGLIDTDREKLRTLSEGLEYDTAEQFEEKLNVLKESYFGNESKSNSDMTFIEEEGTEPLSEEVYSAPQIGAYMNSLSRQMKSAHKVDK